VRWARQWVSITGATPLNRATTKTSARPHLHVLRGGQGGGVGAQLRLRLRLRGRGHGGGRWGQRGQDLHGAAAQPRAAKALRGSQGQRPEAGPMERRGKRATRGQASPAPPTICTAAALPPPPGPASTPGLSSSGAQGCSSVTDWATGCVGGTQQEGCRAV
jgi:hypothetical protein